MAMANVSVSNFLVMPVTVLSLINALTGQPLEYKRGQGAWFLDLQIAWSVLPLSSLLYLSGRTHNDFRIKKRPGSDLPGLQMSGQPDTT
jgi:hypothetical protein